MVSKRPGRTLPRNLSQRAFDENRVRWVTLEHLELVLFRDQKRPSDQQEERLGTATLSGQEERLATADLEEVSVRFSYKAKNIFITLTGMTEAELHAFRDFITGAIDEALPIAQAIDELAESEYKSNGKVFARLYRSVPRVHVNPRWKREHAEGVPLRSDEPPLLVELERARSARVRDGSVELPDGDADDLDAHDDQSEAGGV